MAITYRYVDWPAGSFNDDLGSSPRLGSIDGLVEGAALGQAATSSLAFDDPDGTLGHSGDGFTGWKMLIVKDDAAPSGNQRVFTGLIQARSHQQADSLNQGEAVRVTPTLTDLNALFDLREIRNTKRPAETAKARLTYFLGTEYASGIVDDGLIVYPTHTLEAQDYSGRKFGDVLDDIIKPINWNYFAYWSESADAPALFLDNPIRSDAYVSDLRLSNVLADVDSRVDPTPVVGGTGTFEISGKSTMTVDPQRVYSGVSVPWGKGSYYAQQAGTAAQFISRDGTAPDATLKTLASAKKTAATFLGLASTEDVVIDCEVMLPAANVNDIRAGQLIEAKFREFRGFRDFSWFRVVQRAVKQPMMRDDRYRLGLKLSPATPFTCAGLSDILEDHATFTASVILESGDVTHAYGVFQGWFGIIPLDDAVSVITVSDPANVNDGDVSTYSLCPPAVLRGTGVVSICWDGELDGTYDVCSVNGTNEVGSNSWRSRAPTTVEYWDGSAWQVAAGHLTYTSPSPVPQRWIFTFAQTVTTTKLRFRYAFSVYGTSIGSLSAWNSLGTRVYDLHALGAAA